MPLTMRPTGLASPAYAHLQDWTVLDDGGAVGRLYQDGSLSTPPVTRDLADANVPNASLVHHWCTIGAR
jgi:hypothetical protein